ncbi:MAG: histidinol-phosphate transaminase [Legionella sp.]|nr:MAG: histidinol-phosphate transaminase [Legionella sp.]
MSILNLIRPELLNTPNYVPGGDQAQYRLHANELPWSPLADEEVNLNYYPDNELLKELQSELADRYQVQKDQLVLTRGSDEGIDLITRLFMNAKDALMQFPPTFPMYAFYVRLQQGELLQCPLNLTDFSLNLEQIKACWQPHCKIIMFCSPNNPTGNIFPLDLIAATCAEYQNRSVIVVDEAYMEFAKQQSAISLIPQFENLLVLRTLSKAYGLAGLRLGAVLGQAPLMQALLKVIAPYTIPSPVMQLARRALKKVDWLQQTLARIYQERDWLTLQLQRFDFIEKIYPTETNFILVKTNKAKELSTYLSQQGIALRDFPAYSVLNQHVRITVGDTAQNRLLISALSSFTPYALGLNDAKDLVY